MGFVKNTIEKIKENPIWIILLVALLLRLIYWSNFGNLWWDSQVYIGMGKYLFSFGDSGIWEVFRPVITPVILGIIWKLGLSPVFFGTILDIIFSLISIYLVYKITKKISSISSAIIASILFSIEPLFIFYIGVVLTEPLTIMLSLIAVDLFIKNKKSIKHLILSGIFLSLAFQSKFPAGILLPSFILAILVRKDFSSFKTKFKEGSILCISFFITTLPFFIINSIFYQDPLLPLTTGSSIINTFTSFYGQGIHFYFTHFFSRNLFFMFVFLGIVLFFIKKQYKNEGFATINFITILYLIYFIFFVARKEVRYLTLVLPFISMIVGITISNLLEMISPYTKKIPYKKIIIISVIFYTTYLSLLLPAQEIDQGIDGVKEFYKIHNFNGPILISHPNLISELDNRMLPTTADGAFAILVYEEEKGNFETIVLRTCDFLCENEECNKGKEEFFSLIRSENTLVYSKDFTAKVPIQGECDLNIYMPKMK